MPDFQFPLEPFIWLIMGEDSIAFLVNIISIIYNIYKFYTWSDNTFTVTVWNGDSPSLNGGLVKLRFQSL